MAELIRVYNDMKYDIGVVTLNGIGHNIPPKTFKAFSKDDVEYFVAVAKKLFDEPHQLRIANEEVVVDLGIDTNEDKSSSEDAIAAHLKQSAAKIKDWIEPIEEQHMLALIGEVAGRMDLTASKLQVIKDKLGVLYNE